MTKNMGKTDKIIRIVLALVLVLLDYFEVVKGGFSWVLSIVAIVLVVTTLISFCPLYTLLGKNTCETK